MMNVRFFGLLGLVTVFCLHAGDNVSQLKKDVTIFVKNRSRNNEQEQANKLALRAMMLGVPLNDCVDWSHLKKPLREKAQAILCKRDRWGGRKGGFMCNQRVLMADLLTQGHLKSTVKQFGNPDILTARCFYRAEALMKASGADMSSFYTREILMRECLRRELLASVRNGSLPTEENLKAQFGEGLFNEAYPRYYSRTVPSDCTVLEKADQRVKAGFEWLARTGGDSDVTQRLQSLEHFVRVHKQSEQRNQLAWLPAFLDRWFGKK